MNYVKDCVSGREIQKILLVDRIDAHLKQLPPHMMQRKGVVLLREARDELARLALERLNT